MEIKFSGRYVEQDLQRGLVLMQGRQSRTIGIITTVLLATLVLFFIVSYLSRAVEIGTLLVSLLFPAIVLIVLAGFTWWLPMIQARRIQKAPLFKGTISGIATDEALELHSEVSQGRTKWDAFVQYRMSDEVILLYQNEAAAQIMPRSFFASDGDWQSFRQLVQAKVLGKIQRSRPVWFYIVFGIALLIAIISCLLSYLGNL